MKFTMTIDTADQATLDDARKVLDMFEGGTVAPANAAKAGKSTKADKPAPKKEEPATGTTREQVRKALKEHAVLEGKDAAIAILNEHGAASIGELDEAKFDDVIAAVAASGDI